MKCQTCQQECRDDFYICNPLDFGMIEAAKELGIDAHKHRADHMRAEHNMQIDGALWSCAKGHRVEADAVTVMQASGAARLEGF